MINSVVWLHIIRSLLVTVWCTVRNETRCILTDYFSNYNFSKLKKYAP